MNVAVIGTGFIGGTLGRAFARAGHPTVLGSRTPETDAAAQDSGAATTTVADAVAHADTVVLAVPTTAVEELLTAHGDALAGKLVVDAANNITGPVAHHADLVARHAPKARYARAFNTLGGENLADPDFNGTPADMFYSAPESDRAVLDALITAVGLRPQYLGEGQQDTVDGVLRLWFALAVGQGRGRHLAFHTLER
ncbi:NAD(P)-binding domain-containing protein [Kitasatospora sp. NPDC051914]|uniref:NADPH-dependent F420 reductase n=1 Tax=Kitasatospora sp. NPDC051914 TaxID=3154945 RepID=UPI0034177E6C